MPRVEQSVQSINRGVVEQLAGVAVVLQRHSDRSELTLGYASAGAEPRLARVELGDDPSFATLMQRVSDGFATDGVGSETAADVTVTETAEGTLSVHAPDGPPADRLNQQLTTLLRSAGPAGGQPVSTLPILDDAERNRLLVEWNQTAAPYPDRCVHELIAEQAARTPDRVAVVAGAEQLTYGELDARANQLAHHLIELGVGSEQLVGIAVERSSRMLVGLLGILKAGAAYVPVDPGYPADRVAFMLENSQAPVVLTEERLVAGLPLDGVQVVRLDADWPAIAAHPETAPDRPAPTRDQLAYVIYTSGSTGKPKGVQLPHGALVNFLTTMGQRPGLNADDVLVAVTTLSFDIAGLELYLPLVSGARVVIADATTTGDPRALSELLRRSGATVMQATPTTWRMLLDSGWTAEGGLRALCGGEPLPVALADRLVKIGVELWNMYGPTETTIWSTCARIETVGETLTIGRPIANTTIYLLDRHLEPVPIGVAGELWIGGDGLARGYRGRDDLTAERFIPHPFDDTPGARIYCTGDLARYRDNGEIEFLGRIDNQVKVRGFRIELGEIETVLTRHPDIAEAVVVARGETGADAELAAYVIPEGRIDKAPGARALRDFAALSLPPYMVPSTVTPMHAFPLTPNGKVDRKSLPEPSRVRSDDHELVAPRTPLEQQLASIWERELQISPIGVTDDFFDLGVTSLTAARLFAAIEHELGRGLPLGAIFRAPTIDRLAGLIEGGGDASRWTSLIPIQSEGSQPPIFCVHGGAGTILHLAALSRRLGPDQPFYGLQSRGLYGGAPPLRSVEEMAEHYLAEMRQVHQGGPWRLGGYCFGAIVAFELAQRLTAAGEQVELLAMFNGPSPLWIREWNSYVNQPSWRARHAMPQRATPEQRKVRRRQRKLAKIQDRLSRIPGALADPRKLYRGLLHQTRMPRARLALRLGRPIPEELREEFFLMLHYDAERAYQPRPFPGKITMFYGNALYEDPALGWSTLALGGVDSICVPGVHESNREAMMDPAVDFTAEQLAQRLAQLSPAPTVESAP